MNNFIAKIQQDLESIKRLDGDFEYWSARELMPLLGYSKWERFEQVIQKAMDACEGSGQAIADHFPVSGKMVDIGSGSQRTLDDFLLTRYACYLIAQNGDSRKTEIAFAQTYFALQARKQEVNEQRLKEDKRLEARAKLKMTERKIERTVYERGIRQPKEFASFKNRRIQALYGGLTVNQLKKKRKIPNNRALADFDTQVELKAKDFALAMTDHNIKEKDLVGQPKLEREVIENSRATRKVLLSRGIKPENLQKEEDLKKIEQKRSKEQSQLGNGS